MSLFRKQVIAKQYDNLWGQVSLSQPLSYKVYGIVFVLAVTICLVFLFTTEYHRKERVHGIILPDEGVVHLSSPGRFSVVERYINQGDLVTKGQPLFRLAAPELFGSGESAVEVKKAQLNEQVALLTKQAKNVKSLAQQSVEHLQQKLVEQRAQMLLLTSERDAVLAQLELSQQTLDKHQPLLSSGLVSEDTIKQLRTQHYKLQRETHAINRAINQLEQSQQQSSFDIAKFPKKTRQDLNQIALSISDKKQQLTKLQASTDILITAPTDGTVATIDVYKNQWLHPQQFLMSILPSDLTLHAELYIPTRAYGFIKAGQKTKIKLEAFPFEKFGTVEGTVVKTSTHTQRETKPNTENSAYKVRVKLNKQTILAYGEEVALLSGMGLAADILIDKRTLIEWLLAPLYSLKG